MNIDWVARAQALKPTVRDFINGHWSAVEGSPIDKYCPRDGQLLCRYGEGNPETADVAVSHARRAFADGRWARLRTEHY